MRKKFTLSNVESKPISNTQVKKRWKLMLSQIKQSELGKPPIHYTCQTCGQGMVGGDLLMNHLAKHHFSKWEWSMDLKTVNQGMAIETQIFSSGGIFSRNSSDNTKLNQ